MMLSEILSTKEASGTQKCAKLFIFFSRKSPRWTQVLLLYMRDLVSVKPILVHQDESSVLEVANFLWENNSDVFLDKLPSLEIILQIVSSNNS